MGLKYILSKEDNRLYNDFVDAYWSIDDINYSTKTVSFRLNCYPSREAKYKHNTNMAAPTLPVGSAEPAICYTVLYSWYTYALTEDIFPNGIPLDEDEQRTALYEYVKEFTKIPFEDVFETVGGGTVWRLIDPISLVA